MSGLVRGLRERAKWCNMQPGYGQIGFEVTTAADRIIELEAQLGNAVGAIIDSGGYCEGPHDVADAIYRLTAERDAQREELLAHRAVVDALCNGSAIEPLRAAADPLHTHNTPEPHTDPKEEQQ